jgi:hypothetical protein
MRENAAKQNSQPNWRSVTTCAEIVTRFEAGVVCVDLDSVILEHKPEDGSRMGRVLPLGRKFVKWWQRRGWRVVVLTARSKRHQEILGYLYRNGVQVERVTNRKPYADCYVDDKALRVPKNWK